VRKLSSYLRTLSEFFLIVVDGLLIKDSFPYVAFSTPRKKMFFVSDTLKTVLGLNKWLGHAEEAFRPT
jgi:hypothetical protein